MVQDNYWIPANVHEFQPIHKASTSLSLANWPERNHKAHIATKEAKKRILNMNNYMNTAKNQGKQRAADWILREKKQSQPVLSCLFLFFIMFTFSLSYNLIFPLVNLSFNPSNIFLNLVSLSTAIFSSFSLPRFLKTLLIVSTCSIHFSAPCCFPPNIRWNPNP